MRTRFFTAGHVSGATSPVQNIDFLRLPLPRLLPPPSPDLHLLDGFFDGLHCFDADSPLTVDKFPIENALSKFFSDSLPHFIGAEIGVFVDDRPSTATLCSDIEASEGKNDTKFDGKGDNGVKFLQFEVSEPYPVMISLESTHNLQMENVEIFTSMSDIKIERDMLNVELKQQDFHEIENLIYSVDNIIPAYAIKQKVDLLEDAESIQGVLQNHDAQFPLFEVDEISLGISSGVYAKDEPLIFENIDQNWVQEVELVIDGKEILGSLQVDLLEYLSGHLVQCCKVEVPCFDHFQQMDFIISIEEYSSEDCCQKLSNDDVSWNGSPMLFEEFEFFDLEPSGGFEVFSDVALVGEPETCETKSEEVMNFRSFNELIVSHELTLVDDSFKSLPVPILLEHEQMKSLHSLIQETLEALEPRFSSTSDGLYLDWNFLEEDHGNCSKYSSYWKLLGEINSYNIDYTFHSDELLILNFILTDDGPNKSNSKEAKEILDVSSVTSSTPQISLNHAASNIMPRDGNKERVNEAVPCRTGINSVPSFVESKSHFHDLAFFLNPWECARGEGSKSEFALYTVTTCPVVPSSIPTAATKTVQLEQWTAKFHPVHLSDDILVLLDNIYKNFLSILENDTTFTKYQHLPRVERGLKLLRLSKENLTLFIQKKSAPEAAVAHDYDVDTTLVTLCAIKQMAWYLIYYGVHAAYLYIRKLCRSMEIFRSRLGFLKHLIEDAHTMAEKEIYRFHPSLSVVQEILQSKIDKADCKMLIVAERIFWWPLERLLTSLRISYSSPENSCSRTRVVDDVNGFANSVKDIMLSSACCLICPEFISSSFPFNIFGTVLEYGGPIGSPRVSTISPLAEGCTSIHFLKVDLGESSVAKAICDGIEMPKKIFSELKGDSHCTSASNQQQNKLEEVLNFIPVEESCEGRPVEVLDADETCYVIPPTMEQQTKADLNFPRTLIVVNTLNFEKEMIISRRSSYQKILGLEKEGVQVVERDLNLPVDVLVSAAICLAWYDCKNIGKKATATDEAFSSLPLCVENIAASILTSISFSFSGCVLVFEGESSYITGIMESSDELYAAAASLGIDLQLFYSYSSEMTDEIILSCIEVASKLTRSVYPKMPDSVSLAESFLTSFPSINALSAHAILSSGGILVEFLEWSQERRIRAVHRFQVPDESIALFGALSRYGEHENSKSGMTDCSSSVSSAPDSEKVHFKSYLEKKKRRYDDTHENEDMLIHDSIYRETQKQFSDGRPNPPKTLGSYNSNIHHDIGMSSLSSDDKYKERKRGPGDDLLMKYPKLSQQWKCSMENGTERSDDIGLPNIHRVDMHFHPGQVPKMPLKDSIFKRNKKDSGTTEEDVAGEVIDVDTCLFRNESFLDKPVAFTKFVHDVDEDIMTRSFDPFTAVNYRTFPSAAEVDSDANTWFSNGVRGQSSREGMAQHIDIDLEQNLISRVRQKRPFEESELQKTALVSHESSPHEKNISYCKETPLSNAINSAQLPQGSSPWTTEFLNRIREKSRQRRQSLPCGISSSSYGSSVNSPRSSKRRSPSILEYYKYQGGKPPNKAIKKRSRRQLSKPSYSPTWTPVDKKARRALSFASNGSGGQSKLVWTDNNAYTANRRF